jgi:hypothetical protein
MKGQRDQHAGKTYKFFRYYEKSVQIHKSPRRASTQGNAHASRARHAQHLLMESRQRKKKGAHDGRNEDLYSSRRRKQR